MPLASLLGESQPSSKCPTKVPSPVTTVTTNAEGDTPLMSQRLWSERDLTYLASETGTCPGLAGLLKGSPRAHTQQKPLASRPHPRAG